MRRPAAKPAIAAFKAQRRAIERARMKPPVETPETLYRDRPSRYAKGLGDYSEADLREAARRPYWADRDD